jgi:DSBA-like thioredoxin domain
MAALAGQLRPSHDVEDAAVKARLKNNTDDAIALGIFGVPTFVVDDKIFWGLDALPMLRDYLLDGSWFSDGSWQTAAKVPAGASRNKP